LPCLFLKGLPVSTQIAIIDLEPNQYIEGTYAVQNCQLGMTKSGKPFLKCLLADSTGRAPARMWNASEQLYEMLPTNGFVRVGGTTQPYQGEMQIIIQNIEAVKPTMEDLEKLLPRTKHDIEKMFSTLGLVIDSLEHPAIKALGRAYLNDEELMAKFRYAPAAMTLHHAFIGGLLEHTLSLIRLANVFCPLYPKLNRDIVMMGLFLHDIGKCSELSWETGFGYTEDGHLIGHIARGVIWLEEKAKQCAADGTPIPSAILRVLHHIILSHHGKAEFGALKIPATPEALAVSLLDNLDAKLYMAISATRNDMAEKSDKVSKPGEEGHFTEKIWALETRMFRPDPTTLVDDPPEAPSESSPAPEASPPPSESPPA
jgi:3'-5' exoribonuclease